MNILLLEEGERLAKVIKPDLKVTSRIDAEQDSGKLPLGLISQDRGRLPQERFPRGDSRSRSFYP